MKKKLFYTSIITATIICLTILVGCEMQERAYEQDPAIAADQDASNPAQAITYVDVAERKSLISSNPYEASVSADKRLKEAEMSSSSSGSISVTEQAFELPVTAIDKTAGMDGGMGGMGAGMGGGMSGGMGSRSYASNLTRSELNILHNSGRSGIPLSEPIRHPKNWKQIVERRKVEESFEYAMANFDADEIWVITQPDFPVFGTQEKRPGSGAMVCKRADKENVPLPLKHTEVTGNITGYIATVDVVQQFHNPFDTKIEAIYVFPLPQNAAVNEFIMTVGKRKIRGIIRKKKEAEMIYNQARSQGYTASLLTQVRPNIFTQKVANIEPGKQIDVNIRYFNTLAYVDGWYEFVFPMVVGPRYNPASSGSRSQRKQVISGETAQFQYRPIPDSPNPNPQYLKPNQRSGHDIAVNLNIDAGVKIEQVTSSNHAISKKFNGSSKVAIKLNSNDSIPNKDLVIRYKVAGSKVKSAVMTHRDKRGGYFTMMLYPPEDIKYIKRAPMEMIFVLDCSGSMSGVPMEKSKDAIRRALRKLEPGDSFQVIRFSNKASQLGKKPLEATPENIKIALDYVDKLHGSGGTQMIEGVKAALDFEHDPERFRLVTFLTDGYIGNETDILAAVHDKLGDARIFSFGIGSSVNRYLLDRMAKLGNGAVAYIGSDDSSGEVVDLFYDRISHPALTNVKIDFGQMEVADVFPRKLPDLFAGRAIVVTGRFTGEGPAVVKVTGNVGRYEKTIEIPVNTSKTDAKHKGIASVWARKQIEILATRSVSDKSPKLAENITDIALEYGLMSKFTSFVAVDSSRRTDGDHGVTVQVPVPVPDGVKYETAVQGT